MTITSTLKPPTTVDREPQKSVNLRLTGIDATLYIAMVYTNIFSMKINFFIIYPLQIIFNGLIYPK